MANINKKVGKLISRRGFILVACCMIAWVVLIGRLVVLQFFDYEKYQGGVINNVQRETEVSAQRGAIYDRNMTPLAINATVWRIFISPRDITNTEQAQFIAAKLSEILDVDYDMVLERAGRLNRADETIKRNVEEDEATLVMEFIADNSLTRQIHLEASTKRYYPYGELASHVIGVVGTDQGAFGLELQYDADLKGIPGRYITARTGTGKRMNFKYDTYIEAQNGVNLVTTIDVMIQGFLENQLKQTFIDSEAANRVTGIVMDVDTGAILGMATYPNFDLNTPYTLDEYSQVLLDEYEYADDSDEYRAYYNNLLYTMWKNKAVSELYEPGSTFKVLTSAMALEEDVVELTDSFYCPGYAMVEGYSKRIHCHRRIGHGTVSFVTGLQQSCNPTLMAVAERIGRERFYDYFQAFGYTEKTGVDLPGEASSIFHNYTGFNQVELAVYSFGQTFKVTPLQQLTAVCAIANGGYLVTPHVVSAYVDDNGNMLKTFDTEIKRQVVSSEVCEVLTQILEEGVSGNGGAKNAYVPGYKIAAKTGTSEVRDILNEEGESYLRVGSCVAYAPADDPQIAVIIIVDQPQVVNIYGSVVAAPYVSNFLNEALPYLGYERQYTEEEYGKINRRLVNCTGWPLDDAINTLKNNGFTYKVIGQSTGGDVVSMQIPSTGEMLLDNGKVLLYINGGEPSEASYVQVPNVLDMTAMNANTQITREGLNIHLEGAQNYNIGRGAVVVSQSPEAGELVPEGTIVSITMRYLDGTE